LPSTIAKISDDGETINKNDFIIYFKKSGYLGDIDHIFNLMDKQEEEIIACDDFVEFLLPFVKNVTM
jgi:hypothetical protein